MDQDTTAQTPPHPKNKAELMERIHRTRSELEAAIDGASEARLTTPGGADGWSIKDHLAHVATWEKSLLALLEGRSRPAAVGVDAATYAATDTDGLNAIIHERNKDRPLPDVLDDFRHTHERLLAVLAPLTDDDLHKPYSHYQPNDPPHNPDPVVYWIAGNTYGHYEEHVAAVRALAQAT